MNFNFQILNTYGNARRGILTTKHGTIQTPTFMPVGTKASVKSMFPDSIKSTGTEIILANTYHLMLRPTAERIYRLGQLHKFCNWFGPILTDSGGFQIMSLAPLCKVKKDGVIFKSHLDGSEHFLTPERAVEIQYLLGSTITMALDQCTPYPIDYISAKQAVEVTTRWAEKSRIAFKQRDGYGQFGIIQGSIYEDLRIKSISELTQFDFEGYAIGGELNVKDGPKLMFQVLDYCTSMLPTNKPRYLMGVGKPRDIIGAVERGVDMFDCVIPTRSGRNGQAFTKIGTINIRNAKYADDLCPLEHDCECPACLNYSKAYLHHLVRSNEILGSMLLTWHNINYFQGLMKRIRNYIDANKQFDFSA